MNLLSKHLEAPGPEDGVHGLPRGEVVGQQAPRAPGAQHVEDGVNDLAVGHLAGLASGRGRRQHRFDPLPLGFGQVAGVGGAFPVHGTHSIGLALPRKPMEPSTGKAAPYSPILENSLVFRHALTGRFSMLSFKSSAWVSRDSTETATFAINKRRTPPHRDAASEVFFRPCCRQCAEYLGDDECR